MNINDVIYQGIPTGDVRVELGFAGPNVWTIDSYAYIDGAEQKCRRSASLVHNKTTTYSS